MYLRAPGLIVSRSCRLRVRTEFRLAREEDLAALEWFGEYTDQRDLIHEAFRRQQDGEVVMLLAMIAGFPSGQIWIDLVRQRHEDTGMLYALRVFFLLRGSGLGRVLVRAAEAELRRRGFRIAEIGAEKDNPRARALYERLGYTLIGQRVDPLTFRKPDGELVTANVDQWILSRRLFRE